MFPTVGREVLDAALARGRGDIGEAVEELLNTDPPKKPKKGDTLQRLLDMGFSRVKAKAALAHCEGQVEDAIAVLLRGEGAEDSDDSSDGVQEVFRPPASASIAVSSSSAAAAQPQPAVAPAGAGPTPRDPNRPPPRAAAKATSTPKPPPAPKAPKAAKAPKTPKPKPSPRKRPPAEEPPAAPRVDDLGDRAELLAAVHRWEEAVKQLEADITNATAQAPVITREDQERLSAVFGEMLERFDGPEVRRRHGPLAKPERFVLGIPPEQPVPCYFANVQHSSVACRKALSMLGLRNLCFFGPAIFLELKATLFASDPTLYPPDTGLGKMKLMTGNTVDLDTVVLRLNDPTALQAINAMNRAAGQPEYPHPQAFATSQQALEIAVQAALPLLDSFIADFKLTKAQQKKRHVDPQQLSTTAIPVVDSNQARGRWPLWRYVNCGVDTVHCNVPHLPDVVGALLRSPVAAVRAYLLCRDDPQRLMGFYDDAISDSCFNGKWKALEEFNRALDREGSVVSVLQEVQAAHQAVFTAAFFDNDDEEHHGEIREMVRLTAGRTGRDRSGAVRPITEDDVATWVRNPAADL
jgi:hypothetical protein